MTYVSSVLAENEIEQSLRSFPGSLTDFTFIHLRFSEIIQILSKFIFLTNMK